MGLPNIVLAILTKSSAIKKLIAKSLSDDFDLIFFETAEKILEKFKTKLPDAVIMDHSLGELQTYHFIDKVRNKAYSRHLPFIIVARESSNEIIEKAVRSGISHFVGIPFDRDILLQKVYLALTGKAVDHDQEYFSLPLTLDTQIISFGRISYLSSTGLRFETHLKLHPESLISFSSPLSEALKLPQMEVKVTEVSSDTYYNYPFSVEAQWIDAEITMKVRAWISSHRELNSPKKQKILLVSASAEFQEIFSGFLDASSFSLRSDVSLEMAIKELPIMKPAAVLVMEDVWKSATAIVQSKFLKELGRHSAQWILASDAPDAGKDLQPKPFVAPTAAETLGMAVSQFIPKTEPNPDRLYFSKTLEDSRIKFYLQGKTLQMSELGIRLALSHEIVPPANFQLNLKTFSEQNLRNPYIRIWPPIRISATAESKLTPFKFVADSHFLGINDQQGLAIRQWLRDEELKEKRKALESIPPK